MKERDVCGDYTSASSVLLGGTSQDRWVVTPDRAERCSGTTPPSRGASFPLCRGEDPSVVSKGSLRCGG